MHVRIKNCFRVSKQNNARVNSALFCFRVANSVQLIFILQTFLQENLAVEVCTNLNFITLLNMFSCTLTLRMPRYSKTTTIVVSLFKAILRSTHTISTRLKFKHWNVSFFICVIQQLNIFGPVVNVEWPTRCSRATLF
uniref:Uncharacterized protein n=1 Tax=Pararge aegeria TaxID=116150 RepID=S4PWK2_9NEOP